MSRRRVYSQDGLDIQARYFQTVQELVDEKKIAGGISAYFELHKIDGRHWYAQKEDNGRGYFEAGWLVPLVKYYKVNPNWLLTGRGAQFK